MDKHNEERYFEIRDENGSDFLCPFTDDQINDADNHLHKDDCLEKDVAERYAGNIDIVGRDV